MIRVPRAYRGRTAMRFPVNSSRMCCVELALFYKNPDLICHSENIPPMLKGIAFNEESKSQPKRGGLWLRKRNFRTLDFDLEKGYWILLIQLLLLSIFNILIDVGSCWNRDSFFTFFFYDDDVDEDYNNNGLRSPKNLQYETVYFKKLHKDRAERGLP